MAPTVFLEKDFSRIFNVVQGYGTLFLDRIRERQWCGLVYDNITVEAYYCQDLVKQFYLGIDIATIDHNHFVVHLGHGDFEVTRDTIEENPNPIVPSACCPLPLIEYLTLMGERCTELDHGVRANTTFRNIHCVGRWIQRNIWVSITPLPSTDLHFRLFTVS